MTRSNDHAPSYYATTINRPTDYPRLSGEHNVDVAVVGAGYTGVSAALFLAERGYKVAVVEAQRVGWGASGRNGGQLIDGMVSIDKIEKRLGLQAAQTVYQMGVECRGIVLQRIEQYGIDCDLKFGYLDLAMNEGDVAGFHEEIADKQRMNYPHKVFFVPR
jgi:gamma-glutamylputrescine oxidase